MTHLIVLEFIGADIVKEISDCILSLTSLRKVILEGLALNATFIELFALPELIELSLVDAVIDHQGIIQYNLPSDIDSNDLDAVNNWFDTHFNWNPDAIYWLQNNPICDININNESIPLKLRYCDFNRN